MIRLHIVVEGQTEEGFVREVLAPHLGEVGVFAGAHCVTTRRRRGHIHRGGMLRYAHLRGDLTRWIAQDQNPDAWFSTLIDLYALPNDFPGYDEARILADPYARVAHLEQALARDINHPRFIPYTQLHEFEALLLADPQQLDWEFLEHDAAITRLVAMTARYTTPELINDGEHTAPSKRIIAEIPEYGVRKASAGVIVARAIGLPMIRKRCPHFHQWLTRLEGLDQAQQH